MASKAGYTAKCNHCGKRCALYSEAETLWKHVIRDKSKQCPGTCTADYTDRKQIPVRPSIVYEPTDDYPIRPKAVVTTRAKQFREKPGENWLNRWERKFGVKISDESAKALGRGKYVRRDNEGN
ncbi:hypothetical protein LCGC14_2191350 [marine sediment metagenome]|uniref:Uncharacterized protein n=1 Tax=marine sediment metagenome TaxID=412755 RepID=A0A0F9DJI4_9ZZZZ